MTIRIVRCRIEQGQLVPLEPLPLAEGSEVDVSVPFAADPSNAASLLALMQRLPPIDPSIVDEFERGIAADVKPPLSPARPGVAFRSWNMGVKEPLTRREIYEDVGVIDEASDDTSE